MKITNEGPPPPSPAILESPAIIEIQIDPIIVYNEGGIK